jgi:hypothetical protein
MNRQAPSRWRDYPNFLAVPAGAKAGKRHYRRTRVDRQPRYTGMDICHVLSGTGLCDELITRPEEFYRLWRVVVCDQETS